MVTILDQKPTSGAVSYGQVEYYDDGSEPLGTVTRVIGGSNSRGIPRQEDLVIDPRLLESAADTHGTFGSASNSFVMGIAESADPDRPLQSAVQYTFSHQAQYFASIKELSVDPTIEAIARREATFDLSPAQVLGQVIQSGIGSGILTDASQIAAGAGLSTGSAVRSVETGAVALTFGAIAQAYSDITGTHAIAQVEHRLAGLTSHFLQGVISHQS